MRPFVACICAAVWAAFSPSASQAKDDSISLAPQDRLLVLPIRFLYAKYGLGNSIEAISDKSELAEHNLEGSLDRLGKRERAAQFVGLPPLSVAEQASVREHTELLRLATVGVLTDLAEGNPPWRNDPPWRLDYSIGTGLAFLADRLGVDRAIFVSGARGEPSGGVALVKVAQIVLTQSFLVGAGNQKGLSAAVVNLRSGDLLAAYLPQRGFAGEADDVAGANTWLRALFDIVPDVPRDELVRKRPPHVEKPVRHPRPRRGFAVMRPAGWKTSDSLHLLCFKRHSAALESICIDDKSLDDALNAQGLGAGTDPMKVGEIAVEVLKSDPWFADMQITSLAPAKIAGRDGFRAELNSRLSLGGSTLRERHVVYGVVGPHGALMMRFDAPAIYYFDRHLPDFEAIVPTFSVL